MDASTSRRFEQGFPQLITPLEWQAWADITGTLVRTQEYSVLREMDYRFVAAWRQEITDQRAREH